ncbi:mannosyltransferase [Cladophialophora chaetospira]|uniref:Mannosyltransferase n=1 Tax=Cladophialophora chaetospira TaxID=386627 RepID=A0AA38WX06_9EURO|nr:mannosyltransferase [Cladophialophora chaetospira]
MILRPSRRGGSWYRRRPSLIACLLAFFVVLLFIQTRIHHGPAEPASPSVPRPEAAAEPDQQPVPDAQPPSKTVSPLLDNQAKFWRSLYQIILNNDPNCKNAPDRVVPQKLDIGFDPTQDRQRPDLLYMDTADVKRMREAHSNFVSDMKSIPHLPYESGSRGIVMTGGFNQLPVLVISVRMLRRTGSDLPVEVFVADESEWDDQICKVVLPSLNAKCLLFSDIFHAANTGVSIDRYQFKIIAILFSSFEEVLLLDSDAFPVNNPLALFEKEPFKSSGLIVWPDFWYPSESPYFFEIAKIAAMPRLTERASVESGELMYSKAKHHMSLMLAAYYNYYGPGYYYPLLSQGAPGEGDKETFAWAAIALNEPYYAVHERVMALGRHDTNGNYLGSAMAQHDPIADHNFTEAHGPPTDTGKDNHFDMQASEVKPFFIHANFPKFDPSTIFGHQMTDFADEVVGGPTRDSNGTNVRCWMDPARAVELFGFDVERRFWEEIKTTACEYEQQFGTWRGKTGICLRTQEYWDDVFGAGTSATPLDDRQRMDASVEIPSPP